MAPWKAGIFECGDECCLCCTACFCYCNTTAQIGSKIIGLPCICIAIVLWALFTVQILASMMFNAANSGAMQGPLRLLVPAPLICLVLSFVATMAAAMVRTCTLARSRELLVKKEGMEPEGCPKTCCCSFWCFPCTSTQIFRQMGYGYGPQKVKAYTGPCNIDEWKVRLEVVEPAV